MMSNNGRSALEVAGFCLVLIMALLQGFYAAYAYLDPLAFAALRGTDLVAAGDLDWIRIYASRTLFIALLIVYLLCRLNYKALMWASLFGVVMPVTDLMLAYGADAPVIVLVKHGLTIGYLLLTCAVLQRLIARQKLSKTPNPDAPNVAG